MPIEKISRPASHTIRNPKYRIALVKFGQADRHIHTNPFSLVWDKISNLLYEK